MAFGMTKRLSISNLTVLVTLLLVAFLGNSVGAHSASSAIVVTISSPTSGLTVTGKITWEAKLTTGTASKVEYSVDGGPVQWTEHLAPYYFGADPGLFDTTKLSSGAHNLSVKATDPHGNTATATTKITVSNGSTTPAAGVAISTPTNGQTVAGKISWLATMTSGTATSVAFIVDGTQKAADTSSPFSFNGDGGTLDTTTLTNGSHALSVKATNAAGATATAAINVTVSNGSTTPPPPTGSTLYSSSSPFNTPIASGAAVDPKSSTMVSAIVAAGNKNGFAIAAKSWTVPVYYANASTPKVTVSLLASWAPYKKLASVPMPSGAKPDPSGDGHMAIIDSSTGCEYDFWSAVHHSDGTWAAQWGNAVKTSGNGIYPNGLSAREGGFALGAGLIFPTELSTGQINHALNFSFPYTKTGGPVLPSTEANGKTTVAGAIPEGARIQLDPSLDLTTLGLNAWQTTIARALQKYGMYLSDTGGSLTLYAQNQQSMSTTYPWGDLTYAYLPTSVVSHFRVLTLSSQYTPSSYKVVPVGCGTFS